MIKAFYMIAAIIVFHLLFGWIFGVLLVAVAAGYVFVERPVLISTTVGALLSGTEIVYAYVIAPEAINRMLDLSAHILTDFPDYALIIISLALPVFFYLIASIFSYNAFYVYRKLSV